MQQSASSPGDLQSNLDLSQVDFLPASMFSSVGISNDDFLYGCNDSGVKGALAVPGVSQGGRSPLYPDSITRKGGGTENCIDEDFNDDEFIDGKRNKNCKLEWLLQEEMKKVSFCGKSWSKREVLKSDNLKFQVGDYKIRMSRCGKISCPECGKKGGHRHRLRKHKVYEMLKRVAPLENISLRQFVFTVPKSQREYFINRRRLTSLRRMCIERVRKLLPGKQMVSYVHLYGEDVNEIKPHVNVHVVEKEKVELFVSLDDLNKLKESFYKALLGLGCRCEPNEVMNVQYSFKSKIRKIAHAIKYMTRPVPEYKKVKRLLDSDDPKHRSMLAFLMVEMKGFQYITYPKREWKSIEKSVDGSLEHDQCEGVVFGPPVIESGVWRSFIDQYRNYEREELSPGVYLIRGCLAAARGG